MEIYQNQLVLYIQMEKKNNQNPTSCARDKIPIASVWILI